MSYRLIYFGKRGRGEQVRLLLHDLGTPFEDVRLSHDELAALRAKGADELSFGSVPMLEDGDLRLCQGPVILSYLARKHGLIDSSDLVTAARADELTLGAEDIRITYFNLFGEGGEARQAAFVDGPWKERWVPSFDRHLERNGGDFFVGDSLTHADIAIFDIFDSLLTWVAGADLDASPRLASFYERIKARPAIAAYIASDMRPRG